MRKIAILYICTGKYVVFWKDFFTSYETNFLPKCQKEYFVFTDSQELYGEDNCKRIHKVYQQQLGWPYDTLMRYHMFSGIADKLQEFEYVFFMNANCKCVSQITEEEFLPVSKDILVVQHPGAYNKKPSQFTYDRNPKSTAYIPKGKGQYYVCGGINGGKTQAYFELIEQLYMLFPETVEKEIINLKKLEDETINNIVKKVFNTKNNIFNINSKNNIGYYLNNTFYESLENKDYLKKGYFYIGSFKTDDYNYKLTFENKINTYVGLYQVGELFINDYEENFTLNGLSDNMDNTIFVIDKDKKIYGDNITSKYKIRPVLYLDSNLKILKGTGKIDNKYEIGK